MDNLDRFLKLSNETPLPERPPLGKVRANGRDIPANYGPVTWTNGRFAARRRMHTVKAAQEYDTSLAPLLHRALRIAIPAAIVGYRIYRSSHKNRSKHDKQASFLTLDLIKAASAGGYAPGATTGSHPWDLDAMRPPTNKPAPIPGAPKPYSVPTTAGSPPAASPIAGPKTTAPRPTATQQTIANAANGPGARPPGPDSSPTYSPYTSVAQTTLSEPESRLPGPDSSPTYLPYTNLAQTVLNEPEAPRGTTTPNTSLSRGSQPTSPASPLGNARQMFGSALSGLLAMPQIIGSPYRPPASAPPATASTVPPAQNRAPVSTSPPPIAPRATLDSPAAPATSPASQAPTGWKAPSQAEYDAMARARTADIRRDLEARHVGGLGGPGEYVPPPAPKPYSAEYQHNLMTTLARQRARHHQAPLPITGYSAGPGANAGAPAAPASPAARPSMSRGALSSSLQSMADPALDHGWTHPIGGALASASPATMAALRGALGSAGPRPDVNSAMQGASQLAGSVSNALGRGASQITAPLQNLFTRR